jgi:GH18 family chitinase
VEIRINNHPVEFQLEEENTVADIVDYFIDWSNERELVLFRIEIDGEFFTADDLPGKSVSDMEYMNFVIESKADLVFSSVDEGARYCDRAAKVIDKIISDEEYGIEELRHLPSGIDWISGVIHSVLGILNVSPSEFRYRDRSLRVTWRICRDLNPRSRPCRTAMPPLIIFPRAKGYSPR